MIEVCSYDPEWVDRLQAPRAEDAAALAAADGENATVQRILAAAGLDEAERASTDAHQVPARGRIRPG